MSFLSISTLFFFVFIAAAGCGGATPKKRADLTKEQVVEIEELRITAKRSDEGEFDFEVYDASDLFNKATEFLDREDYGRAAELYDKLVKEFASSRYLSASLYNAGFCLQKIGNLEEAIQRFSDLIKRLPQSKDVKDAYFKMIQIMKVLEYWDQAIISSEQLLARTDLSSEERMEAMVYRAQALLGAKRLDEGEKQARSSLSYYRTRPEQETIRDDYFAAQANFVLAETYRLRAEAMALPAAAVEEQRKVLNRRAELILEAQRQYFNTSQFKAPRLAAASWYRIGNMYDKLWEAIIQAPVPSHLSPEAHEIYRSELAKLIEPLIRHAIRYWEATLMFIERTADHGDWSEKTREEWTERTKRDLEQARQRLLLQTMNKNVPSLKKSDDSDEQIEADAGLSSQ